MERKAAEQLITDYRTQVRHWNMAMAGIERGNVDSLEKWLDARRGTLEQIAVEHPALAQTAIVLSQFRSRLAGNRKVTPNIHGSAE